MVAAQDSPPEAAMDMLLAAEEDKLGSPPVAVEGRLPVAVEGRL